MAVTNNDSEENKGSGKQIVKILVIIGIGIPVLVELLTLFNLINVQFNPDEKERISTERVDEINGVEEGDTLFAEETIPISIDQMRIKVSTPEWRFVLALSVPDSIKDLPQIRLDSMKLASGMVVRVENNLNWGVADEGLSQISGEWNLPASDTPEILYLSAAQLDDKDNSIMMQQKVRLGKLPLRYYSPQN